MDGTTKKFIQEENEKLAFLIYGHITCLEKKIDTVETKMDSGFSEVHKSLDRIENEHGQALGLVH